MVNAIKVSNAGGEDIQERIWQLLESVQDPEIPVLSVVDLGIVRDVKVSADRVEVVITPTYSGCPAMDTIQQDVGHMLQRNGFSDVQITTVLHPPWTTDWLTDAGREKLTAFGIAPPEKASSDKSVLSEEARRIACPRCGSEDTELVSEFGSTACKAFYKCTACLEPFDYFKCI